MTFGLAIAIVGGICACSTWTCDRFVLPQVLVASLGVLIAVSILVFRTIRGTHRPSVSSVEIFAAPVLLSLLVSTCTSIDPWLSILGTYLAPTLGVLQIALLLALAYVVCHSKESVSTERVLVMLCVAGLVVGFVGVLESLGKLCMVPFGGFRTMAGDARLSSVVGNPVFLGSVIAALMPFALKMSLDGGRLRALGIASASTMAYTLFWTRSRGGWLACIVSVVVYIFASGKIRVTRRALIAGLAFVSLCGAGASYMRKDIGKSDTARWEIWRIARKSIASASILGSGPDTFMLTYQKHMTPESVKLNASSRTIHFSAHNDVLQVASTLGVFGLAMYFVVNVLLFSLTLWNMKNDRELGGVLAGSLCAVWCVAKVNPIPFAALAVVAVVIGLLSRMSTDESMSHLSAKPIIVSCFIVCACLFSLNARRVYADAYYLQGIHIRNGGDAIVGARAFRRAYLLMPWEAKYAQNHVVSLFPVPSLVEGEKRERALDDMLSVAHGMTERHPNNPESHQVYARALAMTFVYLKNDALRYAIEASNKAIDLSPQSAELVKFRDALFRVALGRANEGILKTEVL